MAKLIYFKAEKYDMLGKDVGSFLPLFVVLFPTLTIDKNSITPRAASFAQIYEVSLSETLRPVEGEGGSRLE
ncbi:MAG: hypothetical protein AB8B73_15805 [Ekhidna sp.]